MFTPAPAAGRPYRAQGPQEESIVPIHGDEGKALRASSAAGPWAGNPILLAFLLLMAAPPPAPFVSFGKV